jgi:protein-L-isoaspartate O-methyltransferase
VGWAIECGCGPLGCLAVLSELVGPGGTVVGVDFSQATVQRARSVVAVLGIGVVLLSGPTMIELNDGATRLFRGWAMRCRRSRGMARRAGSRG